MSQEPTPTGGAKWVLLGWAVVPAVLLIAVVVAVLMQSPGRTKIDPTKGAAKADANDLAGVRLLLAKATDMVGYKAAVARLNAHLRAAPEHAIAEMAAADRERLKADLGLTDAEVAEAASSTFTALDAHDLEACFLLRDAAAALEVAAPADKGASVRPKPLDRAATGFGWVCRQIRLQPPALDPAPAGFVLRRGWGTPVDRAVAFLALIEQFGVEEDDAAGLQGCLIAVPGKDGPRLWACGVAVGAKPDALYLFDPRIGLPLPGPGGKGIATLAQAQNDPAVLTQLDAGETKYDVTAADAKAAELQLIAPLSGSAPRMLMLQQLLRERAWKGKSLPPAVRVRLAETPAVARATISTAAKGQTVQFAPGLATLLTRSLPKDEGGTDDGIRVDLGSLPGFADSARPLVVTLPRHQWLSLSAVPWTSFPARFRNLDEFGLNAGIGRDLRQLFQAAFTKSLMDPSSPREALLRGRVGPATSEQLVREREHWQQVRSRRMPEDRLREGVERWIDQANKVNAAVLRGGLGEAAAKEDLAKLYRWKPDDAMEVLMGQAIGTPRAMELTYQLGLLMHERGERAAARAALAEANGVPLPDEKERATKAFEAAEGWWRELIDQYAGGSAVPAARRLRGEALWALGRKDEARAVWKDVEEKRAASWLGR